jgi:hypothetical protein
MSSWFHLPVPETTWLVDGLIPSDGHTLICGKPKAGKSTLVRNLIASVIKSRQFIGRSVDIAEGSGRVLYIHLDRKDQPWRVSRELRQLGITQDESPRISFRTKQDIPDSFSERLAWLQKEVMAHIPHLIVIDLLWQFVVADNANDYNAVLDSINTLQDSLTKIAYKGALVVVVHGRKAVNEQDRGDDVLGSSGQRGSFSTTVILSRYRKENLYTIFSEQTERDEIYGEIDETVLHRNADGTLSLLRPFSELVKEEKQSKAEVAIRRVLEYISAHPGCEMTQIVDGLGMAKKTILKALEKAEGFWFTTGAGEKGDPLKYSARPSDADPQAAAMEVMTHDWGK